MSNTLTSLLKDAALLNWNDHGKSSPYQQWAWNRIVSAPRGLAIQALNEHRASLVEEAKSEGFPFHPANLAWELSLKKWKEKLRLAEKRLNSHMTKAYIIPALIRPIFFPHTEKGKSEAIAYAAKLGAKVFEQNGGNFFLIHS